MGKLDPITRLRQELERQAPLRIHEKRMFGGLCFLCDDKMIAGEMRGEWMFRLDPEQHDAWLQRPGLRAMDITGKPLRGFVFADPDALDRAEDLADLVRLALAYWPRAPKPKKKKSPTTAKPS